METSNQNLRQALASYYSLSELKSICFDLNVDYDNFLDTKDDIIRGLVNQLRYELRLIDLVEICVRSRPLVPWFTLVQKHNKEENKEKLYKSTKQAGIGVIILIASLLILFMVSASSFVMGGAVVVGIMIIVALFLDED